MKNELVASNMKRKESACKLIDKLRSSVKLVTPEPTRSKPAQEQRRDSPKEKARALATVTA